MPEGDNIYYCKQTDINRQRWDDCINKAPNGIIYARSIYLDAMCDQWDALILDDYEAVMPLPYRKKFGIYYLYQPFFVAQLGVFGENINSDLFAGFLKNVPSKFRYWDLSFNHQNFFSVPGYKFFKRTNYVLSLWEPYKNLNKRYKESTRRNIKKSIQSQCYVQQDIEEAKIIELARQHTKEIPEKDFDNFSLLYKKFRELNSAKTYGVYSKQMELLASAVFLFSNNRAYYILVGNHAKGKAFGASHALINAFIKDHSQQNILLDFEGSDAPGLAFFYSSFGAKAEKYPAIRLNHLPWFIKWLKK